MARFSRRHYEATAEAVRRARATARILGNATAIEYGIGMVAAELTAMFTIDNPAFDGERFAVASGMRGPR